MAIDRLFVVGASTGGVAALMRLVSSLPDEFDAPMLIVQHIGAHPSILPQLLANASGRDVAHAAAGERIEPRKTRVAPPDCHMMVVDGTIRLTRGPKENCARPAIDPLFRSAALAHGTRVVGVVLTGQLDDGTVGLQEIKRHGGVAVVQDPRDALEPSMPASAIEYTDVDHVVPLDLIPMLLTTLSAAPPEQPPRQPTKDAAAVEMKLSARQGNPMRELEQIAQPSTFACPECHGALWQVLDSRPCRFR